MKVQPYSTTRRKRKRPRIGTLSVSEGPPPQGSGFQLGLAHNNRGNPVVPRMAVPESAVPQITDTRPEFVAATPVITVIENDDPASEVLNRGNVVAEIAGQTGKAIT
ncbi:MAG TPA: hypothetical protein VFB14_29425 [Bryobacteraceae bacterium]|nr:hypothetical protein [Bryobacteraceae bacterium]